jgi:hypothetical protein
LEIKNIEAINKKKYPPTKRVVVKLLKIKKVLEIIFENSKSVAIKENDRIEKLRR